jgi:dolichyl-phosphate mannosyltransferase polypeptide 3
MSRGTRQLAIALPLVLVYLLMLLGVVPVPLISEQRSGEILPVVRA